jgi:hypothetical protein
MPERPVHDRVHVRRLERGAPCPDPRERQQVLDEPLHPQRPVERIADEFICVGVEPALVALAEQLDVAPDHA